MKMFILLCAFSLIVMNVCGQYTINQTINEGYGYYNRKYKTQNQTGKILLWGGTTAAVVGLVGVVNNFDLGNGNSDSNRRANIYSYIFLAGVVADIVSIPFFISSRTNKRKASLNFNYQSISTSKIGTRELNEALVPSFTLRFPF